MINFEQFQLKLMNRMVTHFNNPRVFNTTQFFLPKQSAYHYIPSSTADVGPSDKNALFKKGSLKIPMYSYMDIASRLGTLTIRTATQVIELKKYLKLNRKFKMVVEMDKYKPELIVPLVLNYSLIDRRYRYLGNTNYIGYYRNMNVLNTLLKGMADVSYNYNNYYNQFLFINVPDELLPISSLKRSITGMTVELFRKLDNLESIFILEMWKWLGLNREKSVFANVPKTILDKTNIVLVKNDVFTIFNLGLLDSWRNSEENPAGKIDPRLMSKQFINILLKLNNIFKTKEGIELTEEEIATKNLEADDDAGIETDPDDVIVKRDDAERDYGQIADYRLRRGRALQREEDQENNVDDDDNPDDLEDTNDYHEEAYYNELGEVHQDEDVQVVSDILDDEDELITETESDADLNKLSKMSNIVPVVNEQEDEFEEVINSKFDSSDVLDLKNYKVEDKVPLVKVVDKPISPSIKGKLVLEEYAKSNPMTVSKFDGIRKALTKYNSLSLSKDGGKTVGEMIDIKPEELKITEKDTRGISTLKVFDKKYITEFMERDIASMMVGVQSAGVVVQDIKKTEVENISGAYTVYAMKIKPIEGEASTIRVKIPKVSEDGTFTIGGKTYTYCHQRYDLPIRKIDDSTVSLSSYFGKTFASRDDSRAFNYEKWLIANIRKNAFDQENKDVLETRSGNMFDNHLEAPYVYSVLSRNFKAITTKDCFLYFDRKSAEERFGRDFVIKSEVTGMTFIGTYKKQYPLAIDSENIIYYIQDNNPIELGTIESLCGLDSVKAPTESVNIDIMGKAIPIGLVLCYRLGITKLLASLEPKYYRTEPIGKRLKLENHEYVIRFNDFNLVLSKRDRVTSLIVSGLNKIPDLNKMSIYSLNEKENFFNLLESIKIPGRYLKEIDLYYNMFVDPITERILIEMKEPVDFGGLLIRCVELLVDYKHRDEVDMSEQRIRGFERMSGEVYTHLVRALREHNRHGIKANYPVELNPEAVWMAINKDTTKRIVETLNPIQELKQGEEITFTGNGGRSKQSMVKRTRQHHKNAVGIVSEATKDSSDAGISTYLSANPKFTNLYGIPENSGTGEMNPDLKPENVLSTAMMMMPCSDMDDPKRQVFLGTQSLHSIPATGYHPMPTRTGYDAKLVQRAGDTFAATADKTGKVVEVNDYAIKIQNDDGTFRHIEIGRKFGSSGGFTMPHDIVSNVKVGDRLELGDVIAYHSAFFTKDPLNPKSLAYKSGKLIRVALMESPYTYEDSTAISKRLSLDTEIQTTVVKEVVVNFEQSIHRLAKPGTKVMVDDPLCFIEDALTNDTKLFDEESLDLLRSISANVPKSSVKGVIDKVEVFYNGDKEDMSESLRKIANLSDSKIVARQKALGKAPFTGMVDDTYRVNGNPLMLDTAVIKFTITSNNYLSQGDKLKLF